MLLLKLLHPLLHEGGFLALRVGDRGRGKRGRRLVREQAVLVPVVDGLGDQDVRLRGGGLALGEPDRVHAGRAPRIPFAVDPGETGVAEVEAAVFVDGADVGLPGQVEGVAADNRRVLEVDGAGDQGKLVARHSAAGLEITPSAVPC